MNLEHVGVKGQLCKSEKPLKINVHGQVKSAFVDRPLLQSAGHIAKGLADIGRSKLDAVFLKRIWKQTKGRFFDGALSSVGVGWLVVVGLFVFLAGGAND